MRERRRNAVLAVLGPLLLGSACGDPSWDGPPVGGSRGTDRFELSGTAAGPFAFGSSVDTVVTGMSERFGEPGVTVGPEHYHRHAGQEKWFADEVDPLSPAWGHPVVSVSCWQTLCLVFGGGTEDGLALRGWELATSNRWAAYAETEPASLDVRLAETGIRLGDSWAALHAAYPATTVGGAEGSTLAVDDTPWDGISDGAAAWRLSGVWNFERPTTAPPGATVTRISAGEGPEPGCC